jgi:16S rRNA (guanine966-N2)-methyltransferase
MQIYSGLHKGRILQTPKGLKTRPTSGRLREALFNICQGEVEGTHFLDLFAGSGAMGIEALSRGALSATFVDNSKESIRCIQANMRMINAEKHSEILYGDVFDLLSKLAKRGSSFELIYADPPYDQIAKGEEALSYSGKVLLLIDKLIDDGHSILVTGGSLFLEDAAEALPPKQELKHLTLNSSRRMGRSALQHYYRKS